MLISPRSLCRVRSRSRNQLFLHNRDTRIYNCRWGWRSWDMCKARSLVTKLSRHRLSPMFQLSIWKGSQERVLDIEFLEGYRLLALQNRTKRPRSGSLATPNFREALYKAIVEPSKLPGANERSAGVGLAFVKLFHRRPNGSGGGLQTIIQLAATRSKHPTKWMTEVGSIPTPGSSTPS